MKKFIVIPLLLLSIGLVGQSARLSTFEEMWVVSSEFINTGIDPSGFEDPAVFTPKALNNIKSFQDLNKIVADTPFLSLTLGKAPAKFEKESKEMKLPNISINDRYQPGKSLKGWGSWMGDEYVIGMPTKQPKKVKDYLEKNKVMISDKMGNFSNMTIKEIRIENGTYGKVK